MCRFFSFPWLRHHMMCVPLSSRLSLGCRRSLDWVMRLDTDSFFTAPLEVDLFEEADVRGVDYVYMTVGMEVERMVCPH